MHRNHFSVALAALPASVGNRQFKSVLASVILIVQITIINVECTKYSFSFWYRIIISQKATLRPNSILLYHKELCVYSIHFNAISEWTSDWTYQKTYAKCIYTYICMIKTIDCRKGLKKCWFNWIVPFLDLLILIEIVRNRLNALLVFAGNHMACHIEMIIRSYPAVCIPFGHVPYISNEHIHNCIYMWRIRPLMVITDPLISIAIVVIRIRCVWYMIRL